MAIPNEFKATSEQQLIFDFFLGQGKYPIDLAGWSKRCVSIDSVAGSGKTTTSIKAAKLASQSGRYRKIGFVCFNKSIATDIASKLGPDGHSGTMHSMGMATLRRAGHKSELDSKKYLKILSHRFPTYVDKKGKVLGAYNSVLQLVDLIRNKGLSTDGFINAEVCEYADEQGIILPGEGPLAEVVGAAQEIVSEGASRLETIDFLDMISIPVRNELLRKSTWDLLFADEAQDFNPLQQQFLKGTAESIVIVGDPYQAIMGWAGADSKAFQRLSKDVDARPFSLSTCWRCPSSHLRLARILVPQIHARPDAPEGEVLGVGSEALASKSIPGDLIICRNNSPLISLAYAMIGNNIPCRIQGRSIGQGLINLIEMFKAISVADLVKKVEVYRNRERQKLVEREAEQSAITALNEKLDCLLTISNNCDSVGNIIDVCHNLFSDDEGGSKVILSSIHRAKGMEADNVTILTPSLLCARANDPEAWRQEKNLLYVALTRAKNLLRFCGGFEGDSVESWVRGIAERCSPPGLRNRRNYDR